MTHAVKCLSSVKRHESTVRVTPPYYLRALAVPENVIFEGGKGAVGSSGVVNAGGLVCLSGVHRTDQFVTMECGSNYASGFLKYLSDFVANIRPDDPLPVRAPSYKVTESEIDGQILDIVHHYLNSRECPPYVREYVGHRVWSAIRNPGLNGDGDDEVDAANTTNHTYDAMKLIQEVTGKANTVIREMQANLTVEEVEKLRGYHPISHFAIKNTRRKMEDRHVIIPDLNTLYGMEYQSPHAYYGVFDGHAGTDAAVYSAAHLHQYMIQNPQYETNPEAALKQPSTSLTQTSSRKQEKR
ncbi:protein phosphatase 1F-like [Penaeus japonicus]|uniref:protein phosphatase 1F-like n=1 Tax=Penaeus japonicus TaxID=27405 RepID=UPI001C70E0E6|nr:protein phosphatase 1F-like [Penaeus japonicus]